MLLEKLGSLNDKDVLIVANYDIACHESQLYSKQLYNATSICLEFN